MLRYLFTLLLGIFMASPTAHAANTDPSAQKTAHDFSFISIDGTPMPLSNFAGKVLLVVNTASRCGFTAQYEGLQKLWSTYQDRGLVVLGVPSNDFGGQEPGNAEEIKEFCTINFNINFPMTEKYAVSGKDAHPFYQWASQQAGFLGGPKWNFHKYLIAADGRFLAGYGSITTPQDAKLIAAIEAGLPASVAAAEPTQNQP